MAFKCQPPINNKPQLDRADTGGETAGAPPYLQAAALLSETRVARAKSARFSGKSVR